MPKIGYKKNFKNDNYVYTIYFDLKYTNRGGFKFNNKENYFDSGDTRILLDKIFNEKFDDILKKYDCGITELSILKYIIDNISNIHSIQVESTTTTALYLKEDIIKDYNMIKNQKKETLI